MYVRAAQYVQYVNYYHILGTSKSPISVALLSTIDSQILKRIDAIAGLLEQRDAVVRHLAARLLAVLICERPNRSLRFLLDRVLPRLECAELYARLGGLEAICLTVRLVCRVRPATSGAHLRLVPQSAALLLSLLRSLSDQCDGVRELATDAFPELLRLAALELARDPSESAAGGRADSVLKREATTAPANASEEEPSAKYSSDEDQELQAFLLAKRLESRRFVEQFLSPQRSDPLVLPFSLLNDVQLRAYQQEGINWLWFLNRYKLNGILADDLGLGIALKQPRLRVLIQSDLLRLYPYHTVRAFPIQCFMQCTQLHCTILYIQYIE